LQKRHRCQQIKTHEKATGTGKGDAPEHLYKKGRNELKMQEPLTIKAVETETEKGNNDTNGKKKKELKMDMALDKLELALYRGQLAMVRTATTTTTLGFALYNLLEAKTYDGFDRPFIRIFTPRLVALTLFFAGFLGLISYSIRHVAELRKINRLTPKFYYSGVMLMSYVILTLTFFLFIGMSLNG
jgi:hypothetical protein